MAGIPPGGYRIPEEELRSRHEARAAGFIKSLDPVKRKLCPACSGEGFTSNGTVCMRCGGTKTVLDETDFAPERRQLTPEQELEKLSRFSMRTQPEI